MIDEDAVNKFLTLYETLEANASRIYNRCRKLDRQYKNKGFEFSHEFDCFIVGYGRFELRGSYNYPGNQDEYAFFVNVAEIIDPDAYVEKYRAKLEFEEEQEEQRKKKEADKKKAREDVERYEMFLKLKEEFE